MLRRIGTTGVTFAMFGLASSCAAQTYTPPAPADTFAVRTYSGQPTQWPLRMDTPSGQMAVYQPQPETFEGDKLSARAAISITPPGAHEPIFGALWMQARVATDRDTRTVTILDTDVKRVRFPDSDDAQQKQFEQMVEREFPRMNVTFSLDELLGSLQTVEKEKVASEQLQNAPPRIIVTNVPSTLVMIDGDPKLQPIEQTHIMRVVNTPFIMLMDMDSRRFYLKAGDAWFSSTDIKAPWTAAQNIPATVADSAARLAAPAEANNGAPAPAPAAGPIPRQVIVTTEPAELISTDGPPTYTPVQGSDLLYVSNTQSDVFLEVGTQTTYVLLSGRWYRAHSLQGPWEYVPSDKLPQVFASIPVNSPKGHVLTSVAGTNEARDTHYDAAIPQTAVVKRTGGERLNVVYDGQPQFVSVQDSPVQYATNTPEDVLQVDGRYYACHQAVWYESQAAVGPWAVCVSVPRAIYTLPPSCPVYHVRYCYVYDYTPSVVYCGYVAGYTGCYVYGPTVVWGTGYYYRGWYGTTYYPRPWTWGCGVRYDPYVASWGFGATYGWDRRWMVRDADRYDHSWFGPRGYVGYNRLARVNNVTQLRDTHVNLNIYNRNQNVTRNVNVNRNVNMNRDVAVNEGGRGRNETASGQRNNGYNPPNGNRGGNYQNNVYAGHDGQVYRRTDDGWEQRGRGGWQKVSGVPEAVPAAARGGNQDANRGGQNGNRGGGNVADSGGSNRGGGADRGNNAGQSGDAAAVAAARDTAARESAARDAAARTANNGNRGGNPNADRGGNPNADRGGNPNANRGGNAGGNNNDGARRGSAEAPRRVETPDQARRTPGDSPAVRNGPPGLEADHVARERGEQRVRGNSDGPRQAAPPRSTDGGAANRGNSGSGGGNSGSAGSGSRGSTGTGGGGGGAGSNRGGGSGQGRNR